MKAQSAGPVQTAALFLLTIVVWLIGPAPPAGALLQADPGARPVPSYAYDTAGLDYDLPVAVALSPAANSALSTAQAEGFDAAASKAQGHHRYVYGPATNLVAPTSALDDVLAKPAVSNTKLQNIVNDLYKGTTNPNRVGTGTTADAVRDCLFLCVNVGDRRC